MKPEQLQRVFTDSEANITNGDLFEGIVAHPDGVSLNNVSGSRRQDRA